MLGRSVAIVRLDTGEILRTFARKADAKAPYAPATRSYAAAASSTRRSTRR